jgi:hypothetical protein
MHWAGDMFAKHVQQLHTVHTLDALHCAGVAAGGCYGI